MHYDYDVLDKVSLIFPSVFWQDNIVISKPQVPRKTLVSGYVGALKGDEPLPLTTQTR